MRDGRPLTEREIKEFAGQPGAYRSAVEGYLRSLSSRAHRTSFQHEEKNLFMDADFHGWSNDTYVAAMMGLYTAYHSDKPPERPASGAKRGHATR